MDQTLSKEEIKYLQARHDKLVTVVKQMRFLQKAYFAHHSSLDLDNAKKKEREVDELLKKEDAVAKDNQRKIF